MPKTVNSCSSCGGSGKTRKVVETKTGLQEVLNPCTRCGGSGKIVTTTEGKDVRESKYLTE